MAAIVLPGTVHDPTTGGVAPALWGDALNAAIAWLANPPQVKITHNAAQAKTTAVALALAFNTEYYDNDTMHDVTTNNSRLTCRTAGVYHIEGNVRFASNATGTREIFIRHSNGATPIAYTLVPAVNGNVTIVHVACDYQMNVNEYLELLVSQNSGGNLNLDAIGGYSPIEVCLTQRHTPAVN